MVHAVSEEPETLGTGYVFNETLTGAEPYDANISYPSECDLSKEPWFPPIRSQGSQSSCAAWAVTYYCYGYMEAKDNNWTDAWLGNSAHLMSPAWTYNKVNGGVDGGSSLSTNALILTHFGCASMATMSYSSSDYIGYGAPPAWNEAPYHRISGYYATTHMTIDSIKNKIVNGVPVAFAMNANDYYPAFADGNYIMSSIEMTQGMNHANTFVGYNDNVTDDGEMGAFRVANSWGISFGSMGFYWITYEAVLAQMARNSGAYTYLTDKAGYQPQVAIYWKYSDAPSRDGKFVINVAGMEKKPYLALDSNHRFPTYMVVDITEFIDYKDSPVQLSMDRLTSIVGNYTDYRVFRYRNYTGPQVGTFPSLTNVSVYAYLWYSYPLVADIEVT